MSVINVKRLSVNAARCHTCLPNSFLLRGLLLLQPYDAIFTYLIYYSCFLCRYRSIFAPYLRGEANRVVPGGSTQVPSLMQRVEACCEALLGEVDFWREQVPGATSASSEQQSVPKGSMALMVQVLEGVRVSVEYV
jgi:hypothetical protein